RQAGDRARLRQNRMRRAPSAPEGRAGPWPRFAWSGFCRRLLPLLLSASEIQSPIQPRFTLSPTIMDAAFQSRKKRARQGFCPHEQTNQTHFSIAFQIDSQYGASGFSLAIMTQKSYKARKD